MRNKKFVRIKKTLTILLILCFALSVTAVPSSAADSKNKDGYNDGYNKGYNKGYRDGKKQAQKDCEQYGSRETLSKIPSPPIRDNWTKYYKDRYNKGYKKGYIDGYNGNRYACLKMNHPSLNSPPEGSGF